MVAALIGGVVWLVPRSGEPDTVSLAGATPTPSSPTSTKSTSRPKTSTPKPRETPRKTKKPTQRATPTTPRTRTQTPTQSPTRTTKRPEPIRTTKKPATSAKVSILEIRLVGGPGQSSASGCYMPPIGFSTDMESSRQGVWISYAWLIDGKTRHSNRSWVPEDAYTAPALAHQYMLDPGSHTITLRVTSPTSTSKSVKINVCDIEQY